MFQRTVYLKESSRTSSICKCIYAVQHLNSALSLFMQTSDVVQSQLVLFFGHINSCVLCCVSVNRSCVLCGVSSRETDQRC